MKGTPVSPSARQPQYGQASPSAAASSSPKVQPMELSGSTASTTQARSSSSSCSSHSSTTLHVNSNYPHMNYLTIVQDPYPPLNNSPDFFDSAHFSEQMPSIIDCIDMADFDLSQFERGPNNG